VLFATDFTCSFQRVRGELGGGDLPSPTCARLLYAILRSVDGAFLGCLAYAVTSLTADDYSFLLRLPASDLYCVLHHYSSSGPVWLRCASPCIALANATTCTSTVTPGGPRAVFTFCGVLERARQRKRLLGMYRLDYPQRTGFTGEQASMPLCLLPYRDLYLPFGAGKGGNAPAGAGWYAAAVNAFSAAFCGSRRFCYCVCAYASAFFSSYPAPGAYPLRTPAFRCCCVPFIHVVTTARTLA
jgi:hypothetical protein